MPAISQDVPETRLTLQSRLEDLSLVWRWVEALAAQYEFSPDTEFAVNLCLEEAVSNVIRHGYGADPGQEISIDFTSSGIDGFSFTIEDRAQPFNPMEFSATRGSSAPATLDELQPGGRGIGLLRKFTRSLTYERVPGGNRLTLGFERTSQAAGS